MKIIVAYIPVLHQGYYWFLQENQTAKVLYVVDRNWVKTISPDLEYLRKEVRTLDAEAVVKAVEAWQMFDQVRVLNESALAELKEVANLQIVAPDEDVSHEITQLLTQAKVDFQPVFLRWDRSRAFDVKDVEADVEISQSEFDQSMMKRAFEAAGNSTDQWRHVGAVIVDPAGKVITTGANRHQPSELTPYQDGDVRSLASRGEKIEFATSTHAELDAIVQAAAGGMDLKNAQLYATTFPCPYCARAIAGSGLKTLYFSEGYAILDGETILKNAGVKIIKVEVDNKTLALADKKTRTVPYPKKTDTH